MDFGTIAAISGDVGIIYRNIGKLDKKIAKMNGAPFCMMLRCKYLETLGRYMDLGQSSRNMFIFVNSELTGSTFEL